jgi:hypothetical protein
MHKSLFVLGIATATLGVGAIIYGIPVNEFSFGNTLIIAGTIAVVGGFILIGLSAAVRQLTRIAEASDISPSLQLPANQLTPSFQSDIHAGQHMQSSSANPIPRRRSQAALDQALGGTGAAESEVLDWMRPREKAAGQRGQSLIEEMEQSLFSSSPRPEAPSPKSLDSSPSARQWPLPRPHELTAPSSHAIEPSPQNESFSESFEAAWPEIRPARTAESVARMRGSDSVAPAQTDKADSEGSPETQASVPPESRPMAILKSGKIDGMSYTLYADGSIEAVLATGPIRFASIDALRTHLEKNS